MWGRKSEEKLDLIRSERGEENGRGHPGVSIGSLQVGKFLAHKLSLMQ